MSRKHRKGPRQDVDVVTPPKPLPPKPLAITPQLARSLVGVGFGEAPANPISVVLAKEGAFEVRENTIGKLVRRIGDLPNIPLPSTTLTPGWTFKLPKIPWETVAEIVAFFRAVNDKHKSEAYASVWWHEGAYHTHVPTQRISGASVHHDQTHDPLDGIHVLDIHSHDTMGAFFSSVDDADESKGDRCFGVVGKITQVIPETKWRIRAGKQFFDITPATIIDLPNMQATVNFSLGQMLTATGSTDGTASVKVQYDPFKGVTFPAEWMEQIKPASLTGIRTMGRGMMSYFQGDEEGPWAHVLCPPREDVTSPSAQSNYMIMAGGKMFRRLPDGSLVEEKGSALKGNE